VLSAAGLAGCGLLGPRTPGLFVVRQAIDSDFYASAQVLTPDPLATDYPAGERLVVSWSIPEGWLTATSLDLRIDVYYRNRSRETLRWNVERSRGTVTVDCLGQTFEETHGLMTYNIELLRDGQVMLAEPHQLWFRWIEAPA
jgi:hypothetical protein